MDVKQALAERLRAAFPGMRITYPAQLVERVTYSPPQVEAEGTPVSSTQFLPFVPDDPTGWKPGKSVAEYRADMKRAIRRNRNRRLAESGGLR